MQLFKFLVVMVLLPLINGYVFGEPNFTNLTSLLNEYRNNYPQLTYKIDKTQFPNSPSILNCNYSEELDKQGLRLYTLHGNIFTHCEKIISLNLTSNQIYAIKDHVFQNLPNLNVIDLSSNNISTIPTNIFSNTKKLEQFYISQNRITSLQGYLFANLPYLKIVDFQFNEIASIERNCFVNVPSLTIISLRYNNLQTLQMNIIDDMNSLLQLYLDGNEWNCDIDLCEFMQTVVTLFWYEPFVPVCYAPNSTWGATWKEVIETPVPAISSNIRARNVVLKCYTCSKDSIMWQYDSSKSLTNKAVQSSGKYNTLSTLTFNYFSLSDVGNYTCFVNDCPSCDSSTSVYVYIDFTGSTVHHKPYTYSGFNVGLSVLGAFLFILGICCRVYKCSGAADSGVQYESTPNNRLRNSEYSPAYTT